MENEAKHYRNRDEVATQSAPESSCRSAPQRQAEQGSPRHRRLFREAAPIIVRVAVQLVLWWITRDGWHHPWGQ
jgi:hypothetical protein